MKTKLFVVLDTVFLGLGLLLFTPAANPTSPTGKVSNPSSSTATLQTTPFYSKTNLKPDGNLKPLAVWECVSSWYGEPFDGQPTATGEVYNMYGATAAHPTLPLGSIVRVINPRNHKSEIVRINDRGPYVAGRELDVSYQVARNLGFEQRGLAKLRLELLKVPSRPDPDHHN